MGFRFFFYFYFFNEMSFKRPRAREGGQLKLMDNNSKQENHLENLSNPHDATTFSRELIANKNPTSILHSFNRESLSFFCLPGKSQFNSMFIIA